MQLDQCLACTRYEPVLGQMYELLNDVGTNVAAVLDDNQMGYTNMEEYAVQNRSEKYHKEQENAQINLGTVQTKDEVSYNDKEFKTRWGKGIAMDWHLVPKEDQKTHINWRQSINDDGSNLKRLASFPQDETNGGANATTNKAASNKMKKNKEAMDSNSNSLLQPWIDLGKKAGENVGDALLNKIKGGWAKEIRTAIGTQKGIDPLVVAACAHIANKDVSEIISKLVDIQGTTGVDNPALNVAAYSSGINAIMGDNDKIPRIDKVTKAQADKKTREENKDDSTNKDDNSNKDEDKKPEGETYHLNWDNRDTWFFTEFGEPLSINTKANQGNLTDDMMAFFPKVCYLYCALLPYCKTSEFDGDEMAFPFTDEQIQAGINFTSKYGPRDGRIHHGIDLEAAHGTEIHAIADGTVIDPSGWGASDCNAVIIDHGNGKYSKYLHCSSHAVKVGDTVAQGDVIAYVGGWGEGHDGKYDDHLHLEIGPEALAGSSQNPIDYYPLLANCEPERGNHWYDLAAKQMH